LKKEWKLKGSDKWRGLKTKQIPDLRDSNGVEMIHQETDQVKELRKK